MRRYIKNALNEGKQCNLAYALDDALQGYNYSPHFGISMMVPAEVYSWDINKDKEQIEALR